jgi:hypothetical protein
VEIREERPIFGSLLRFWIDVKGKGCRPVGLPTLRPILVSINRYLGNVSRVVIVVHLCDV